MALVVDASVAMGWLAPSQANSLSDATLTVLGRERGWVPGHFGIEVARALRRLERRNILPVDQVEASLANLVRLRLRQDRDDTLNHIERIVELARHHALKVADAAYLELALRIGLPLATRDQSLAEAANKAGVTLFAR